MLRPANNVTKPLRTSLVAFVIIFWAAIAPAQTTDAPVASTLPATITNAAPSETAAQQWNWHVQNTDIIDGHPAYPAKYSGPNSLRRDSELQETVSLDLLLGARLWHGAEAHLDGL